MAPKANEAATMKQRSVSSAAALFSKCENIAAEISYGWYREKPIVLMIMAWRGAAAMKPGNDARANIKRSRNVCIINIVA